jgi:hypothetical protein
MVDVGSEPWRTFMPLVVNDFLAESVTTRNAC